MYKVMKILKRSQFPGSPPRYRILEEPDPTLKIIQKKLLRKMQSIVDRAPLSNICGFMGPDTGTAPAACWHTGAKFLLQLDIADFFGSITKEMVRESLEQWLMLVPVLAETIAEICTFNNHLPQGAPCSSYLANIAAMNLYCELFEFASARNMMFSVYVDDMYFSCEHSDKLQESIPEIRKILEKHKFKLKDEKIKISKPGQRQQVMDVCVAGVNHWAVQLQRLSKRERHRVFSAIHNLKAGKDTHSIHHVMGLVNNAKRVKDPQWMKMIVKFEEARQAWKARQAATPVTNLKDLAKRRKPYGIELPE